MGTIDGTDWSNVTIDGQEVQEITMDGNVVWTALPSDPIEDFEWGGSLSDRYVGDTGYFEISTYNAQNGSYHLRHPDHSGPHSIIRTQGNVRPPEPGDKFSVWQTSDEGSWHHQSFFFGVINTNMTDGVPDNGYSLDLYQRDGSQNIYLRVHDSGNVSDLDSDSVSNISPNEYHEWVVEWYTNGDIIVNIKDSSGSILHTLSGNDTTYTDGEIAFRGSSDTSPYKLFDNVRFLDSL